MRMNGANNDDEDSWRELTTSIFSFFLPRDFSNAQIPGWKKVSRDNSENAPLQNNKFHLLGMFPRLIHLIKFSMQDNFHSRTEKRWSKPCFPASLCQTIRAKSRRGCHAWIFEFLASLCFPFWMTQFSRPELSRGWTEKKELEQNP